MTIKSDTFLTGSEFTILLYVRRGVELNIKVRSIILG